MWTGLMMRDTSEEMVEAVRRLVWASDETRPRWDKRRETEKRSEPWRQGVATKQGYFLSDFVEDLIDQPGLREAIRTKNPSVSDDDLEALEHALWCIVTGVQMYRELLSVESRVEEDPRIGVDEWVVGYMSKFKDGWR